ncbi:hypothetical protein TL16_g00830 [Triparma laevis f. inornata]|uniref:Signal recognition particle subunit SRP72 n=2 Tax=Triparma laevis TaxID=1534972 RepID=A0A9W7FBR3_9STRA|nr:hypothetical protein TL16_g00830 [Triparma laevis f. inornata]GMI09255.1 hypothetical protein TrLO_g2037 [Triparma laevis f. longispina]
MAIITITSTLQKLSTLNSLLSTAAVSSLLSSFKKLTLEMHAVLVSLSKSAYTSSDSKSDDLAGYSGVFETPTEFFRWAYEVAMESYLTCLIRNGDYGKAVEAVEDHEKRSTGLQQRTGAQDPPPPTFNAHKGYAYYRMKKFGKALAVAPDEEGESLAHIKSQALYRLGRYDDSITSYLKIPSWSSDPEVVTNIVSSMAQGGSSSDVNISNVSELEVFQEDYDVMYNVATAHLEDREDVKARKILADADEKCRSLLTKKEYESLSLNLKAQQVCADHSSASSYSYVGLRTGGDAGLQLVKTNNFLSKESEGGKAKERTWLLDAIKTLEEELKDGADKVTERAKSAVEQNVKVLKAVVGEGKDADLKGSDMGGAFGARVKVIKAALEGSSDAKSVAEGIKGEEREEQLVKAQLYIDFQLYREAIAALEGMEELRKEPAMIKTLSDLYSKAGDRARANSLLKDSIDAGGGESLKIANGESLVKEGEYEKAGKIFDEIMEGGECDDETRVLALRVLATSYYDVDSCETLVNDLPAVEEGDGESLEFAPLPREVSRLRSQSSLLAVDTDSERLERKRLIKAKRMKERKEKREKHLLRLESVGTYDPNRPVAPDPERWLPKNQRSYNKKGRKNRHNFSGAQGAGGGAFKDAEKLDAAKRAEGGNDAFSTKHLQVGAGGKRSRQPRR